MPAQSFAAHALLLPTYRASVSQCCCTSSAS
jgi:hypothetical protein